MRKEVLKNHKKKKTNLKRKKHEQQKLGKIDESV